MTLLDDCKSKVWTWNGKQTKLGDLKDSQLYSIQETLKKSKNKWFGQSKDYWLNAIRPILKERQRENINILTNMINQRHRVRVDNDIERQLQQIRIKNKQSKNEKTYDINNSF